MPRRVKKDYFSHDTNPIKSVKDLEKLLTYLKQQIEHAPTQVKEYQAYRNYIMFVVAINFGLRAEDYLQLKVNAILNDRKKLEIVENKTGKRQAIPIKADVIETVRKYVDKYDLKSNDYLFRGQKKKVNGKPYYLPITRQNAHKIADNACKSVGINERIGLHGLRKTYGYQMYMEGVDLLTIQHSYNHESADVTLRYIKWDKMDVEAARKRKTSFL